MPAKLQNPQGIPRPRPIRIVDAGRIRTARVALLRASHLRLAAAEANLLQLAGTRGRPAHAALFARDAA